MISNLFASTAAKVITALALLLAVVGFVLWLKWDDSAQPKQDARSANATAETAMEAAQVVIDRSQGDQSIDELVAETSKAIENETDPQVAGALARDAICKLLYDSHDPACVVQ
jgi:hypothetical protein